MKSRAATAEFPAEAEPTGTWLRLPPLDAPFLVGAVVHQFKIGTLDSSTMPVPPHLVRFRVGSVNRLDFFGWAQFGIVRMTDRTVPAGTVIDSEARTVDPRRLRSYPFWPRPNDHEDHHFSFRECLRDRPGGGRAGQEYRRRPAPGMVPGGGGDRDAPAGLLPRPIGHGSRGLHRRRRRFLAPLPSRPRLLVRVFGGCALAVSGLSDPGRQRSVCGAGAVRPADAAHTGDR